MLTLNRIHYCVLDLIVGGKMVCVNQSSHFYHDNFSSSILPLKGLFASKPDSAFMSSYLNVAWLVFYFEKSDGDFIPLFPCRGTAGVPTVVQTSVFLEDVSYFYDPWHGVIIHCL